MIPLVSDVYTASRAVLGDVRVATGDVYTDSILQPHYQHAFSELYRALQGSQNPKVLRENYYNVPANTGYLSPATAGIFNMGEVQSVEERKNVSSWAIATFTPGVGFVTITTTTPTTLSSGQQAVVFGMTGVTDDVNDMWTVTVVDPSTIKLDGCTSIVTGTPSGGTLSYSTEEFLTVLRVPRIDWVDQAPTDRFLVYAWEGDVLRFPPANSVIQVRIVYQLSGNAPTATTLSVGIDDSLGFLAYRTSGLVAFSRGMMQRAQVYNNLAVGPNWESSGQAGGILFQLTQPGVRNLQGLPPWARRPPAFGRARSRRWMVW
jgi:hypothetical protein